MEKHESAGWIRDAIEVLREYREYGEAMREIGRGCDPVGISGASVDDILSALRSIAEEAGFGEESRKEGAA